MDIFQRQEWLNAVDNLKTKAREFNRVYNDVSISYPKDPALLSERNSLLDKGDWVKGTIEKTTSSIDAVYGVIKEWGFSESLNGLGVIPLIPVAIILSAIGAISYWINDALKYLEKVGRIERLENEGYSTKAASEIVFGESFSIKQYLPWVIGGVLALTILPPVIRNLRS